MVKTARDGANGAETALHGLEETGTDKRRGVLRVAVYGTLKEGCANHAWAARAGAVKVAEGTVGGYLYDTGCGYPIAQVGIDPGVAKFKVEVIEVDYEGLAHLDVLEGFPTLYTRETVLVEVTKTDREDLRVACNAIIYVPVNPRRWRGLARLTRDESGTASW